MTNVPLGLIIDVDADDTLDLRDGTILIRCIVGIIDFDVMVSVIGLAKTVSRQMTSPDDSASVQG